MTRHDRPAVPASLAGLLITAVILGGLVMFSPGDEFATTRRLLGLSGERHGTPPRVATGQGSHAFLLTQRGSDEPVAWDPCRPIAYAVNPDGAPVGWQDLVAASVAEVEWATGIEMDDRGTTDRRPFDPLYGVPVAQPVVIAFADEREMPELAGDVAGLGGGVPEADAIGRQYYVTGSVALDTRVFTSRAVESRFADLRAVLTHELGHVLGLDHVADPGELMAAANDGQSTWGPGDLEGLAILASAPCR